MVMATTDYPAYIMDVVLNNGIEFSVVIGAIPGLPEQVDDQLAAAAARAIRDFAWSTIPVSPQVSSATVTLTRQDITNTDVALS